MNKLAASVGLVALSAAGLQATDLGLDSPQKPWSVSATLRGFYDDNVNTVASSASHDSFGIEISPSIGLVFSPDPTLVLTAGYLYSGKWYDRRPDGNSSNWDHTHTFNVGLDKRFTERYALKLTDSFVIGQEPDILRAGNSFATFERIPGDNIRNYGAISGTAQVTPLLGFEAGYANSYYDYSAHGPDFSTGDLIPSASGLLDRIEHSIHIDSRWTIQPETIGIVGGQLRFVNYTANEEIAADPTGKVDFLRSEARDFREYTGYIGVEQIFSPVLLANVRVGASYNDFYNNPTGSGTGWGPYADASVRWTYLPQSYVLVGLTEEISATDLVGSQSASTITSSAQTTVLYGSVNHQITPKLKGSLLAQFQNNSYNGGNIGTTEQLYLLGLNLAYQFTPHFSSEVGYNYDKLSSDIPGRAFDRNRVYIGVTASY